MKWIYKRSIWLLTSFPSATIFDDETVRRGSQHEDALLVKFFRHAVGKRFDAVPFRKVLIAVTARGQDKSLPFLVQDFTT